MTVTSPEYLYDNSNGASAWGASYHYKLRSQNSSFATYDLWSIDTEDWYVGTLNTGGWAIKVGIDPSDTSNYNKWIDGFTTGDYQPTSVTDPIDTGGTDVKLYTENISLPRFQFTKPTTASWISSSTPVETLIKTVDTTPASSGTTSESFDPVAWYWYWYAVDNQDDDIVRVNIMNIVSQQISDFSAALQDKVSGVVSVIQGAVIAANPDNSAEYEVTINLPENTIKDNIILITDDTNNGNVIGSVDFEPVSGRRKVSCNFW